MADLPFIDEYKLDAFLRKLAIMFRCNLYDIKRTDPEYMSEYQKLRNDIPKAPSSLKKEILDYVEKINDILEDIVGAKKK